MDKNKHRHVFVIRILPRRYVDDHNEKYTGFLKIFFYDPTSRETYLEYYDWDDVVLSHPYRIGKDAYLFSEFTYQNPDTGEIISQDYTHTKAYPLPRDKEYDPPEGIKLCAELNLSAYEKAFEAWKRFEDLYRNPPVSTRATGILNHYKRVVADCKQWYYENCPEYSPKLSHGSTDTTTKMPDKTNMKKHPRENGDLPRLSNWSELTITFNSLETIQIRVEGHKPVTRHFASLADRGFIDKRSGDLQNRLWEELQILASYEGELKYDGPFLKFTPRRKTEERLSKLRKILKKIFQLDAAPIKWNKGDGYHCLFHIGAEPQVLEMLSQRWS